MMDLTISLEEGMINSSRQNGERNWLDCATNEDRARSCEISDERRLEHSRRDDHHR
jgi:hypothetical protein